MRLNTIADKITNEIKTVNPDTYDWEMKNGAVFTFPQEQFRYIVLNWGVSNPDYVLGKIFRSFGLDYTKRTQLKVLNRRIEIQNNQKNGNEN